MSARWPGLSFTGFPLDTRTIGITPLESALPRYLISEENKRLTATKFPSQLFCLQHLRRPLASALSKGLITPIESALTENVSVTPLESALTKNIGGGGAPQRLTARFAHPSSSSCAPPAHSAALLHFPAPHRETSSRRILLPAFSPPPSATPGS